MAAQLAELLAMKKDVENLKKQVKDLQSKTGKHDTDINSVRGKAESALSKANSASSAASNALNTANSAVGLANSVKASLASTQGQVDSLRKDLTTMKSSINAINTSIAGVDFKQVNFVLSKMGTQEKLMATVQNIIGPTYIQSQITPAFLQGKLVDANYAFAIGKVADDAYGLQGSRGPMKYLTKTLADHDTILGGLKKSIADHEGKFTTLNSALTSLTKDFGGIKDKLSKVRDSATCLKKQFTNLNDNLDPSGGKWKAAIDAFKKDLNDEWERTTPGIHAPGDWIRIISNFLRSTAAIIRQTASDVKACLTTMETNLK